MKRILLIAFLFSPKLLFSASVLWNVGVRFNWNDCIDENWGGGGTLLDLLYMDIYSDISFGIKQTGSANGRRIISGVIDLGREAWYVVAEFGDTIDAETTKDPSRVFITNTGVVDYEDGVKPEYLASEPWTFYLGFETTQYGVQKIYGWMEFYVDNYTVTLGNTCIDLSGRPVVVGVRPEELIPEPASGALALLGATLLFRRREH